MKKLIAIGLLIVWSCFGLIIAGGTKTVTTSGTAVPLASTQTLVVWGTVQALSTNTGTICIGGSNVSAATKNGTCLTAGQAAPLGNVGGIRNYDLSQIYMDATVSGEGGGLTYAY